MAFTKSLTALERTDSHARINGSKMSIKNAATPSANKTSLDNRTVASNDPSATLTTRSKAFIFNSVRLPETRSNKTSAA